MVMHKNTQKLEKYMDRFCLYHCYSLVMIKTLVIITLIFSFSVKAENLGDWLSENNSIVIKYLASLSDSIKGQSVPGVRLSDGHFSKFNK